MFLLNSTFSKSNWREMSIFLRILHERKTWELLHIVALNPHHLRWIEHHSHQMDALMLVMRAMRGMRVMRVMRDGSNTTLIRWMHLCWSWEWWENVHLNREIIASTRTTGLEQNLFAVSKGFEIFLCASIRRKKQPSDNSINCLITAKSALNQQCFLSDFITQPTVEEKHCQRPMEHQTSSLES